MKKIQTHTIYQCSFCDFQDTSPKVVGKHEWDCKQNTVIKPAEKIRRERRNALYASETINDLNDKLLQYMDDYFPDIKRKWSLNSIKFSLSKKYTTSYSLTCSYPTAIQAKMGIQYTLEHYPILKKKLDELERLKELFSSQKSVYNTAREVALDKDIYTSKLYVDYQNERNELMLQKKQIENKIESLAIAHQKRIDDYCDEFKKTFNYIDYGVEIEQLHNELGIK